MEFLKLDFKSFSRTINIDVKDHFKDLKKIFRENFRVINRVLKIEILNMDF